MKVESIYVLIIHLLLLSGCGSPTPPPTPSPEPTITQPPAPTSPVVIVVTTYPKLQLPTATSKARAATIEPTATPAPTLAPTPTVPAPKFSSTIRFSADEPNQSEAREVFLFGTQQIFAMWDYSNMNPTNIIRRDWYHDGELWLTREEPWDLDRWGTEGTVSDISVYDFESELEPGVYRLELYIDDKAQFPDNTLDNSMSFRVLEEPQSEPLPSPDGTRFALVLPPDTIMIQETEDRQRKFVITSEIFISKWFPDSQHLLYITVDRTRQSWNRNLPWMRIRTELWVVDVLTGEHYQLSTAREGLNRPVISPDGRYVAALDGSGYIDACHGGYDLWIIALDEQFSRKILYDITDFSWSAIDSGFDGMYLVDAPNILVPGIWQTNTQLIVGVDWMCAGLNPRGIYQFDVTTLTAEKISDLERP